MLLHWWRYEFHAREVLGSSNTYSILTDETDSSWIITYTHSLGVGGLGTTQSAPWWLHWKQHEPPQALGELCSIKGVKCPSGFIESDYDWLPWIIPCIVGQETETWQSYSKVSLAQLITKYLIHRNRGKRNLAAGPSQFQMSMEYLIFRQL